VTSTDLKASHARRTSSSGALSAMCSESPVGVDPSDQRPSIALPAPPIHKNAAPRSHLERGLQTDDVTVERKRAIEVAHGQMGLEEAGGLGNGVHAMLTTIGFISTQWDTSGGRGPGAVGLRRAASSAAVALQSWRSAIRYAYVCPLRHPAAARAPKQPAAASCGPLRLQITQNSRPTDIGGRTISHGSSGAKPPTRRGSRGRRNGIRS
jgi:hypothetical protein